MGDLIAIPILAMVFGFVLIVVRMAINHEREKLKIKSGASDKSLTTTELRSMIEDAVLEFMEPLEKRIAALEGHGSGKEADPDPVLPDHAGSLNLDDIESLREEPPLVTRQRVR